MASQMDVTEAIEKLQNSNAVCIDIPPDTPRASNWAPHQHTPALNLSRVDLSNLPVGQFPPRQQPPVGEEDVLDRPTIVLGSYLGKQAPESLVCDTYKAALRFGEAKTTPGLVVKLLDLAAWPPTTLVFKHFIEEGQFFTMAASAQGKALPRYGGLFASGSLFCHVFEDAGESLPQHEMCTKVVQDEIVEAIKLIHATGVLNVVSDPSSEIRRDPQGRIKITDLFGSATLATYTPEVCEEWASRNRDMVGKTPEEVFELAKQYSVRQTLDELSQLDESPDSYDSDSD